MATPDRLSTDADAGPPEDDPCDAVTVHQSGHEKLVFTEKDNTDAWISTDTTVDVSR